MDTTVMTIFAVAILAIMIVAGFISFQVISETKPPRKQRVGVEPCAICFGDLGGPIALCPCGKAFHDSCAVPTGSCPYCKKRYEEFEVYEEEVPKCPNCGKAVGTYSCSCGAIFPNDGEFVCSCGSVINSDLKCPNCGTEYTMMGEKE